MCRPPPPHPWASSLHPQASQRQLRGDQSRSLDRTKPLLEKPQKRYGSLLTGAGSSARPAIFGREAFQVLARASGADVDREPPAFRGLCGQQAWAGIWIAHRPGEQRPADTALMSRPRQGQLSGVPGGACSVPRPGISESFQTERKGTEQMSLGDLPDTSSAQHSVDVLSSSSFLLLLILFGEYFSMDFFFF